MHTTALLAVAVFVLLYGLVSKKLEGTPITAPILAVLFGIAAGPFGLGVIHAERDGEFAKVLAEVTLALVLFHDAARIDLRVLRKNLGTPERLLGPGLALTVVAGLGAGVLFLPDLTLWELALLAAMLAPTDAALGQAVVTQESVPSRVRQALNVESGLNDGMIVPLVALFLACAAGEQSDSAWTWVRHAGEAAGYGIGVGLLVGLTSAALLDRAAAAGWMHSGSRRVAMAAVPLIAFFAAESVHGSGFLAAFIGGLALGSTTKHLERHLYDFTEDSGEFLGMVTWVVFGVAAAPAALECASPGVIAYALASLTVVRMVPVALSLKGLGYSRDAVLFLGWFGPRGLASVVFAIAVLDREGIAGAETVFGVATWTILLSVLLHGATAAPLAKAFGRRSAEEEHHDVPDLPFARGERGTP